MAIIGVVFAVFAYLLIEVKGYSALLIIPAVITFTIGMMNLTKLEASRD